MVAGPRYIASARTAQKTPLPTALMLFLACLLRQSLSHCQATCVYTQPFPNNGYLCWLYNSAFQQTCHNINLFTTKFVTMVHQCTYYVFGHYPSSCLYLKHLPVYFSKHNVLETGLSPSSGKTYSVSPKHR
jgi:hypothetical protein